MAAYAQLIDKGVALIAASPDRAGSIDRSDVGLGIRSLHLGLVAHRRRAAVHYLYYVTGRLTDGSIGTIVLRVLHQRMEPRRRVIRSLNAGTKGSTR
jgi:toxin ParE1/3/4